MVKPILDTELTEENTSMLFKPPQVDKEPIYDLTKDFTFPY